MKRVHCFLQVAIGVLWFGSGACTLQEGGLHEVAPPSVPNELEVASDRLTVTDGDTLRFEHRGERVRVRLKGINAPEKKECLGEEATRALAELVRDGVRVERTGEDSYGRWLAYLWTPEGRLVQTALVEGGLALANDYGRPDRHSEVLVQAQRDAQRERKGMFGVSACGAPAGVAVKVGTMDPNPKGEDLAPGAGESVTLEGPAGVDLSGWTLKDLTASHRIHFPDGTHLDGQGKLRVYSSCGAAREGVFFVCAKGSAIWNNGGDTAFLLDPNGNIVHSRDWRPTGSSSR